MGISIERPPIDASASDIAHLAVELIGVIDVSEGQAEWAPDVGDDDLLALLANMHLTREFEQRMQASQRQGKTSFSVSSKGEEAIGTCTAFVMGENDMAFPTYRQASYLLQRGRPVIDLINQIYGNSGDELSGTRLPTMHTSREHGFFTVSGSLGTQLPQAVGWAMENQRSNKGTATIGFIGDGSTATGDFHAAMTFASAFRPPVIFAIVNNQYAISTPESVARGMAETLAQRGVGYGIPTLRVDGNDALAVIGATQWCRQRVIAGHGPAAVEFVTYRHSAHSTSDDPTRYRDASEATQGDPIERLEAHLRSTGVDSKVLEQVAEKAKVTVEEANAEAEALGTLATHGVPSIAVAFDHVFEDMPPNLIKQRKEAGY